MFKSVALLSSALLLLACAPTAISQPAQNPSSQPGQAPGSGTNSPVSMIVWTKSDLEITADCLSFSGNPLGKQLGSSVNSALNALERTRTASGLNQAAYQGQLNSIGSGLSKAKAQGSLDYKAGACIKY